MGVHLGCSFPLLFAPTQVLHQAEAGLVALGAHPARLVVQGLGALCADGLRGYKKNGKFSIGSARVLPRRMLFFFPPAVPSDAYRSAGLAVVFTLGEIEALVAALTRLLLFVLFPGTLLELEKKKQPKKRDESEVFNVNALSYKLQHR